MKISREIWIGFVVLAAIVLLIWGINFLRNKPLFSKDKMVYAVYEDVGGLGKSSPVSIRGIQVGQVEKVFFDPSGKSNKVIVEMLITDPIGIPGNSVAKLVSSDLMGTKSIDIIMGDSKKMISPGDTIHSETENTLKEEVNRQVLPLKKKAEDLILSIDSLVLIFQQVLNSSTRENLVLTFESIKNSFRNLEQTSYNLDTIVGTQKTRVQRIFTNIENISANLDSNQDNLNNIIRNFSDISDTIAKARVYETFTNLNTTVSDISVLLKNVNQGKGSLGKLATNDSLYFELEKSAKELNLLLEDIRKNPKKYVKLSLF